MRNFERTVLINMLCFAAVAGGFVVACSTDNPGAATEDGGTADGPVAPAPDGAIPDGSVPDTSVPAKKCTKATDCPSGVCNLDSGKCLAASCKDGVKNANETDIDCGGDCAKCEVGKTCKLPADCAGAVCKDTGTGLKCQAPTCTDLAKNQDETDVDCGGLVCGKCADGKNCNVRNDCLGDLCTAAKKCKTPTCNDGIITPPKTDVDCGGPNCPRCADNQMCKVAGDCTSGVCADVGGVLRCQPPSCTDGVLNGDETDTDCGGSCSATPAGQCDSTKACKVSLDCKSLGCDYNNKCALARSCISRHGGDTCGPAGNESCCVTLPAGAVNIDKYNITAGRFRAFVDATGGDLKGYIAAYTPAWWVASWSNFLPSMLDNGLISPDDAPAFSGVYQELGPYVHAPGAVGANEGCYIKGSGARTYRIPDAVNTRMGDPQLYTQDFLDERPLNCVTNYMLAAFCAWDGGRMPTHQEIDVAWGAGKYPWGAGAPLGYHYAHNVDPNGMLEGSYNPFQGAPYTAAPLSATDLVWANYNYNYWGGSTRVGLDYSIYLAPPGRFPNGNSATGHADLAGSVFNSTDINGTNVYWSRSGSWQGHTIPWTGKGSWLNTLATHKYWAMGGRCARP